MKRILLTIILACSVSNNLFAASVSGSGKIYIDPDVAQRVLEKHFSHMVTGNAAYMDSEMTDEKVFMNVLDVYANMLKQNAGMVSADGLIDVCIAAFDNLYINSDKLSEYPNEQDASNWFNNLFNQTCLAFTIDLIKSEPPQNMQTGCPYKVSKVNNSQMQIKYELPNGSGFVRKGGTIAWRFFNPGNLRGSDLQCTTIKTRPNGSFAVFPNAEVGKQALHQLLSSSKIYQGKTVRQAIFKYAPPSDGNNTNKYVKDLQKMGINVDAKLQTLTPAEFEKLENIIMTIEGWPRHEKARQVGTEIKF